MTSYREFWPYYIAQHRTPACRRLHFAGTSCALALLATAIAKANPWLIAAAPIAGYGFAWIGHFVFEKNRPATFGHPFWSLRADFEMYFRMLFRRSLD